MPLTPSKEVSGGIGDPTIEALQKPSTDFISFMLMAAERRQLSMREFCFVVVILGFGWKGCVLVL